MVDHGDGKFQSLSATIHAEVEVYVLGSHVEFYVWLKNSTSAKNVSDKYSIAVTNVVYLSFTFYHDFHPFATISM